MACKLPLSVLKRSDYSNGGEKEILGHKSLDIIYLDNAGLIKNSLNIQDFNYSQREFGLAKTEKTEMSIFIYLTQVVTTECIISMGENTCENEVC